MRLIDADALIWHFGEVDDNDTKRWDFFVTADEMREMSTVDAVPVRHGKWIRDEFGARCSGCGLYAYRDKFDKPWESPYCPNCGARMGADESV